VLRVDSSIFSPNALKQFITDQCTSYGTVKNVTVLWNYGNSDRIAAALVDMASCDETTAVSREFGNAMFGNSAMIMIEQAPN